MGSIVANLNTFILPCFFYIYFGYKTNSHNLFSVKNIVPIILICLGIVFMIICNIYSIVELIEHNSHQEGGHHDDSSSSSSEHQE